MINKDQARQDALEFLQENSTAVIATSFKEDPKASTVYYYTDDDFNFYFITKRNTSKYINAELNPKAAIVVGTGPEHISVQAHGQVELIVDDVEKEKIMQMVIGKQNLKGVTVWPIETLKNLKDNQKVLFKIVPDELFYMNLDSSKHVETIIDEHMKII